jgi:3-deoxy-manno-octulosonate cytidylyltransferase (CMP-KDO synthetase)
MNIIGIIPARFGSSRFEGKPLIDIQGMSMIQRVYLQCKKAKTNGSFHF